VKALSDAGYLSVLIPQEYGSSGLLSLPKTSYMLILLTLVALDR